MTTPGQEAELARRLRQEAIRARDEHGNTDFYALLNEASAYLSRARAEAMEEAAKLVEATDTFNYPRAINYLPRAIRALSQSPRTESEVEHGRCSNHDGFAGAAEHTDTGKADVTRSDSGSAGAPEMREALQDFIRAWGFWPGSKDPAAFEGWCKRHFEPAVGRARAALSSATEGERK